MRFYNDFNEHKIEEIANQWKNKSFVFLHHTGYVYGMGCRVDDIAAIERLKKLKGRDLEKGFVVLLPGFHAISVNGKRLTETGSNFPPVDLELNHQSLAILEQYLPGNLTVVLKHDQSNENLNRLSRDGKLAIRIPRDQTLRDFIDALGVPIISTSINKTGESPLTDLEEIIKLSWFDFAVIDKFSSHAIGFVSTIVEPNGSELICHRKGSIPFSEIEESYHEPLILFVCTGNICRSPLAEYYTRHEIKKNKLKFRTESAGFALDKIKISANSFSILKKDGIEVDEHLSQKVTTELMRKSWLVLTMELYHYDKVLRAFPNAKHKVFNLSEFSGDYGDVEDPFQRNLEVFESIYSQIKRYCLVLVDKLEYRTNNLIFIDQLAKEIIEE